MNYLYILKCNEFYKIGISSNIKSRLSGLQTGNPYKIELIGLFNVISAKGLEDILHEALKDKRHTREWFLMSQSEVNAIIEILSEAK